MTDETNRCEFTDTDPLHWTTYRCHGTATQDGFCKSHIGSIHHRVKMEKQHDESRIVKSAGTIHR